ncbi:UNVERIFIED_CONTAM: hypothetical protein FKN15_070934 [Acipenser sinensis]
MLYDPPLTYKAVSQQTSRYFCICPGDCCYLQNNTTEFQTFKLFQSQGPDTPTTHQYC